MNGLDDRELRLNYIVRRRRELTDELRRIAQQREAFDAKQRPRFEAPLALPAPPMFGGNTPHKSHLPGSASKKRPAVTPLAKSQSLLTEPAIGLPTDSNKRARIEAEREKRVSAIFSQCLTVLKQIFKLKDAVPFQKPVDIALLKIPDYFQIIKQPMDFTTIQKKLEHKPEKGIFRKYKEPAEFVADMRLVFENCRTYNAVGTPVRRMGDGISEVWEKKWRTSGLQEKWELEKIRQKHEDLEGSGEASIPQRMRELRDDLHRMVEAEQRRAVKEPPGPHRAMSFEEKRKLSIAIGKLPGDRLAEVVEIISEDPFAHNVLGDGELEVSLDDLSQQTHWRLDSYVNGILQQGRPTKTAGTGEGNSGGMSVDVTEVRHDQEDTSRHPGAARPPDTGNAPARPPAQPKRPSSSSGSETSSASESGGEVGSKQIAEAGATGDQGEIQQKREQPQGDGRDMTFFSATAPSGKTQILKGMSKTKKTSEVDHGAWARLASTPGEAPVVPDDDEPPAPADDGEDLWADFQSREQQQTQRAEEKKAEEMRIAALVAAKEEEIRKQEEAVKREAQEEADALKRQEEEEAEQRRRDIEAQREKELQAMKAASSGVNLNANQELVEHLKHGSSGTDNALAGFGLMPKRDEDDFEDSDDEAGSEDGEMA